MTGSVVVGDVAGPLVFRLRWNDSLEKKKHCAPAVSSLFFAVLMMSAC